MSSCLSPARRTWNSLSLPESCLNRLALSDASVCDGVINSSFKLGQAAQTSIGLSALSAAHFHELRTGVTQDVSVDPRHAAVEFHSQAYYTIDGKLPVERDPIHGLYEVKDNKYVRIHTNFPHHRKGILSILGLQDLPNLSRSEVAKRMLKWDAYEFEEAAAKRGVCAFVFRSLHEWKAHPQAKALENTPPVTVIKIGDAPRRAPIKDVSRPLEGIKILDLSRVLAGPVAGRTLAAHGAEVLLVTSPNLPSLPFLDPDTSRGKRTTQLDLETSAGAERLIELASGADVFLQAYRPGALESKGFGSKVLFESRPGIICANLCAWGWEGPWSGRRGFDSMVQTATGFNYDEGLFFAASEGTTQTGVIPRTLPMQALDHTAGYLLATGINAALCKTITEGGSWEVQVSLAAVGQWIRSLGRLEPRAAFKEGNPLPPATIPPSPEIEALSDDWDYSGKEVNGSQERSPVIKAIRHAAKLSVTPVNPNGSRKAPLRLDADSAAWKFK